MYPENAAEQLKNFIHAVDQVGIDGVIVTSDEASEPMLIPTDAPGLHGTRIYASYATSVVRRFQGKLIEDAKYKFIALKNHGNCDETVVPPCDEAYCNGRGICKEKPWSIDHICICNSPYSGDRCKEENEVILLVIKLCAGAPHNFKGLKSSKCTSQQ